MHLTRSVFQISEIDRVCRTTLGASGQVFAIGDRPFFDVGLFFGLDKSMAAKGALLNDADHSERDVRIVTSIEHAVPSRLIPIEHLRRVRAGSHAIPASDAAMVDLAHKPLFVQIRRMHRTDPRARRVVTMETRLRISM